MKTVLFVALGTLAVATWASAGTISFSATIPTLGSGVSSTVNLTKFNTSLGTLTGVTLELDFTGAATVTSLNLGALAVPFTGASSFAPFRLTGPDGTFVQALITTGLLSGTAPPSVGFVFTSFPGSPISGAQTANVPALNLLSYESPGVQPLVLTAAFGSATSSGPGTGSLFFGSGPASAGGTATVTFAFTAPEPNSLALLGSALLGLGAIRRLRKAK